MKKQFIATAMAIVGINTLCLQPACCKVVDASIIEINEQKENDTLLFYKNKIYLSPQLLKIDRQIDIMVAEKKEQACKAEQQRILYQQKEQNRIDNVQFDSYDIGVPSGITYEEMAKVLADSHYSNFVSMSDAFVDAERAYGVNAFALVAIPGLESGWNKSDRAKDGNNNIVGMNVPKNASRGTIYDSKHQCILDLARQIRMYYLTPGAEHYNGPSTSQINKKYSADPNWYKQVDKIGDELMARYHSLY